MDLFDEMIAVFRALRDAGVEVALCGGLAVALHGHVRATRDIDLLIREEDVEAALEAVNTLGFRFKANLMQFPDGMRIQRVSRVQGRELLTIDLLLVGPETESAWASRQSFTLGGATITAISREALIAMKAWAGRPQDLADIERLADGDR